MDVGPPYGIVSASTLAILGRSPMILNATPNTYQLVGQLGPLRMNTRIGNTHLESTELALELLLVTQRC
jgi:hypothetical protein